MAAHACHDPLCTRQPLKPANMGEKTSFSCVKYVFFGFNIFVWLLGCGVLSLGVWLQVNRSPHMAILPSHSFFSASALCITAGAIILLVGFLGCCGAFYENQCMLIGYFIMVLLIFTLEITAGTLGFLHKNELCPHKKILCEAYNDKGKPIFPLQLRGVIQKDLLLSIQQDYRVVSDGQETTYQHTDRQPKEHEEWWLVMDSLQAELECCGVNNHSDWFNIKAWPTEHRVPDSCCKEPGTSCGRLDPRFWFERGCMAEVDYWFVRNMYILGVVGITVAVIQILGMVAAVVLFCYIRNNKFFL